MSRAIDALIAFRLIKLLVTPFNKTKAYKLGIIDDKGKVLIKARDFPKAFPSYSIGPRIPTFCNNLLRLKTKRISIVYAFLPANLSLDVGSLSISLDFIQTLPLASIMPSLYALVLLKGVTNSFINLNAIKASIALLIKFVLTFP